MITKINALVSIRPGAQWSWAGNDYAGLDWLDGLQIKPTEQEIDDELARLQAAEPNRIAEQNRLLAYRSESDPLFFKAQRGEVTLDDWKNKVAEIKLRFPKE